MLGLDEATARRIFDDEAAEGFLTDREAMYGGQSQQYDSKGRAIDKEGNLTDPDDIEAAEEEDDDEPVSNVYECGNCGYTLFVVALGTAGGQRRLGSGNWGWFQGAEESMGRPWCLVDDGICQRC